MSSGSELLRSLRKQQQQQRQRQQNFRRFHDHDEEISAKKKAGDGTQTAADADIDKVITIEVCLGPDCSGSGGGAALLEIEELVSPSPCYQAKMKGGDATDETKKVVRVVPGGCRDFCTVGPNVYVKNNVGGNDEGHYSKVDCPEACRAITSSIDEKEESADTGLAAEASTSAILRRRQDGIRWRLHRERAAKERRLKVRERADGAA